MASGVNLDECEQRARAVLRYYDPEASLASDVLALVAELRAATQERDELAEVTERNRLLEAVAREARDLCWTYGNHDVPWGKVKDALRSAGVELLDNSSVDHPRGGGRVNARRLTERNQLLEAMVAALPRCRGTDWKDNGAFDSCERIATRRCEGDRKPYCDEHLDDDEDDLPYAAALRALEAADREAGEK